ncbi:uncharacterized protein LOC105780854 isoform X1 [Gossypium raimondii]|uniref:uncharacterized protein LOC105780854 isoform X1 n=1 Tax=Gossypium raimondii TaxID=29730 RepID=UPI00063A94E9|nr:uncharacterized protein LOC105780854 isoform X1 [Gossypium raimondii]
MGSTSNGVSSTQKVGKSLAASAAYSHRMCRSVGFLRFLMMFLESLSMLTSLISHFFSKNGSLEACIHFNGCQISNVVDRCHLLDLFYEDVVLEDVAYKLIFFSTKWA